MSQILFYNPGQLATITLDITVNGVRNDGYEYIADGYVPIVERIILPNFTPASGYPQTMSRADIGLYYFNFAIPQGATSVGTYLIDVMYLDPTIGSPKTLLYQIVVSAPFGIYSATTT